MTERDGEKAEKTQRKAARKGKERYMYIERYNIKGQKKEKVTYINTVLCLRLVKSRTIK